MTALEIKELRILTGLSQEKFAQKIGVALMTVYFWENGRRKPSPLAMEKLISIKKEYLN